MAYIIRADIEATFGVENVNKWADLDNDGLETKIDARITEGITAAEEDCNTSLDGGPYTIPLSSAPTLIKTICVKLAGAWLYDARGTDDVDSEGFPVNKLRVHLKDARRMLDEILGGRRVLNVAFKCKASPTARVQTFVDGERAIVVES